MKKYIFKIFGPKYDTNTASLFYWFYVAVILPFHILWGILILEGFFLSRAYKESFTGLGLIVLSFPFFVLFFRIFYKVAAKICNWK
ncbi:MAG: hypothetical protein COA82_07815 [Alkaliphilus sp.]|nr:hypothetical protein [bacterium AH-315-L21]PHS33887.1 MAG: hypothetical protein COA82_07815 [Alkaliphilus sp.]